MDDETVQDWDQFILRFSKLQDSMGNSLFPSLLAYLQETYENRPMLDILRRLERLGYINSVDDWNNIRVVRNGFTHDYPEDNAIKAENLNSAVSMVEVLGQWLARVRPIIEIKSCKSSLSH